MPTSVPLGPEPVSPEFCLLRPHLRKAAPPPHLLQSLRTPNSPNSHRAAALPSSSEVAQPLASLVVSSMASLSPVRRENLSKVLYPSSGHNGLWIFAPHASTGRRPFFFGCLRGMQRGTTLAEIHPCWQRLILSSTFFMVLEGSKDSQCSRRLG